MPLQRIQRPIRDIWNLRYTRDLLEWKYGTGAPRNLKDAPEPLTDYLDVSDAVVEREMGGGKEGRKETEARGKGGKREKRCTGLGLINEQLLICICNFKNST